MPRQGPAEQSVRLLPYLGYHVWRSSSRFHGPGIQAPRAAPSLVASDDEGAGMSGRWSSTQTYDPQETACPREAADGGSFAPLASAKQLHRTTLGRGGRPQRGREGRGG